MKSMIAIITTFILAAISASVLAMPCSQAQHNSGEALDNQHRMPLYVTQHEPGRASDLWLAEGGADRLKEQHRTG